MHFLPTASATTWFISLIYDFHEPGVSSYLGHRVPAAVNISLQLTTSILPTKTKVYGYSRIIREPSKHSYFVKLRFKFN
jgi:hypothetical protein